MKTGPIAKSTEKRFKYDSFLSSGKSWYRNECPSSDSADNLCQYLWGPYVRHKTFPDWAGNAAKAGGGSGTSSNVTLVCRNVTTAIANLTSS